MSFILLFLVHLNTYVMHLRPLEIFQFFQRGERLYTSESDVSRRQNLTSIKTVPALKGVILAVTFARATGLDLSSLLGF